MPILILLIALNLVSCVSSSRRDQTSLDRQEVDALTLDLARIRKAQIQKVDYDLFVKADKKTSNYQYRVNVHLVLNETNRPLNFDYIGKSIERVVVNGSLVEDFRVRTGSLEIPAKYLKAQTQVEIEGTNEYNKDGVGFQKTVDLEDGREYLYTDFEPYDAHKFFPCFDQPDLKAKYHVSVEAPSDWMAIGNAPIERTEKQGERVLTTFQETKPISTYLVFMGLGPFAVWEDKAEGVPLRLLARQSLAKYVDAARMFDTTKKGMKFYSEYFGHPYPFLKYDQIFVPEFMSGGMENVGAVVINERNIPRGKMTAAQLLGRDSLILHEMAHMWFGDLVTMSWWNDLWLNESFATYSASLAIERALGNRDAWISFLYSKSAAYHEDSLISTHPIEAPVTDTATAMANFDMITYGKGASVLKQLHFTVGEKAFRSGLKDYFTTFAYKNTTRPDFTSTIAKAWGHDLESWSNAWLQSAGPNRVSADWSCKAGKIQKFEAVQKPNITGALASHKSRVGLYRKTGDQLKLFKSIELTYASERSAVADFIGLACPDFVNLNVDDYDYALIDLDPVSYKQLKFALGGGLQSAIDRAALWPILAEMVNEGRASILDYFDILSSALKVEPNRLIVQLLTSDRGQFSDFYFTFLTKAQRDQVAPGLEKALEGRLSDLQNFDLYVRVARTPRALAKLQGYLHNQNVPKGVEVDQDRRWQILRTLARENAPDVEKLIAEERKKDPTTSGAKFELSARTALPSLEAKRDFWKKLLNPGTTPFQDLRSAAADFRSADAPELFEPLADEYFRYLETLDWANHGTLVGPAIGAMLPVHSCTPAMLKRSEASLKAARSLSSFARREWMEANEKLERCMKIRAKAAK